MKFLQVGYRSPLAILAGRPHILCIWRGSHLKCHSRTTPCSFKALVRPDIRAVAGRHGWVLSNRNLLYDCSHVLPPVNLQSCSAKQSFSSSRRMYVLNSDKLSSHFASHSTSSALFFSLCCLPTLQSLRTSLLVLPHSSRPLDKCELNSILN